MKSTDAWTGGDNDDEYDGDELDFIGRVKRDVERVRFILSLRDDHANSAIPTNYRQIVEVTEDLLTLLHSKLSQGLGTFEANR